MSYKAHEFENHFMIEHPDGSSFPVAKKGLNKAALSKIQAMAPKKMAAGGVVPGLDDTANASTLPEPPAQKLEDPTIGIPTATPQQMAVDSTKEYLQKLNPGIYASAPDLLDRDAQNMMLNRYTRDDNAKNADMYAKQKDAQIKFAEDSEYNANAAKHGLPLRQLSAPAMPEKNNMTPAVTSADGAMNPSEQQSQHGSPNGMMAAYGDMLKNNESSLNSYNKQLDGASGLVGAAYRDQIKQANVESQLHQKNMAALDAEHQKLSDDYTTGKLDPNRVWSNMSSGNKVTAAISLALGGIGAGITGKSNAALDVINNAIDRDLESQKTDINKKHTILGMNEQSKRDENLSYASKKADLISATQAKIGLATAQSQNAQAKLQGAQLVQGFQLQKLALLNEEAKNMTKAQMAGLGTGQGGIQTDKIPYSMLSDEKSMEKAIDVDGRTYLAKTADDAKDLKNMLSEHKPVLDMVKQLSAIGPAALFPGKEQDRANAIRAYLVPRLNKLHGLNRLSEPDIELMKEQLKDPSKFSSILKGNVKNDQFIKNLEDDIHENLGQRLIGYKPLRTLQ